MAQTDVEEPERNYKGLLGGDGTGFRCLIIVRGIEPNVRTWKKPITIARHAYGDVYKNAEIVVPGKGKSRSLPLQVRTELRYGADT